MVNVPAAATTTSATTTIIIAVATQSILIIVVVATVFSIRKVVRRRRQAKAAGKSVDTENGPGTSTNFRRYLPDGNVWFGTVRSGTTAASDVTSVTSDDTSP